MRALLQEDVHFVDPDPPALPAAASTSASAGAAAADPTPASPNPDSSSSASSSSSSSSLLPPSVAGAVNTFKTLLSKSKTTRSLFDKKPPNPSPSPSPSAATSAVVMEQKSGPSSAASATSLTASTNSALMGSTGSTQSGLMSSTSSLTSSSSSSASASGAAGAVSSASASTAAAPSASASIAVFGGGSGGGAAQRTVRFKLVKRTVDLFVHKAVRATARWPWQCLHLVAEALAFSAQQWPALYPAQRQALVAQLLFAQLVLPALKKPALSGLTPAAAALNKRQKWNVSVVCSILQHIFVPQFSLTSASSLNVSAPPSPSAAASASPSPSPSAARSGGVPFPDSHYLSPLNSYVLEHARTVRRSIESLTALIEAIPVAAAAAASAPSVPPSSPTHASASSAFAAALSMSGGGNSLPPALAYTGTVCLTLAEIKVKRLRLTEQRQK
jgi:hypothetical protein